LSLHIVLSVNDPPVWVLPDDQVTRIQSALAGDRVTDARRADVRRDAMADADVLLATSTTADEIARAARLKWIHSTAVGVARLLPPAVVESDLVVTNSRGVHSDAIAEHAIALVLALRRQLHTAAARQRDRVWAQVELSTIPIRPLANTTLLVVGLGTIGARIAALASGLEMRVIGVRKRAELPRPAGVDEVLPVEQFKDALPRADAVVLAIPRTHDNQVLLGQTELDLMKPTAILVNIARGQLIDEAALLGALASSRIAGAGLDAFHQEPLPASHPFWSLPNVLITPHTAAFANEYWAPVVDLFLENVRRFRRGAPLLNLVDKRRGY
jgi:phosphoglycerate dehydrogenase-like enzyme